MGMPGSSEWLIILGIALLLFGPKKLPQLGGALGESIKNFRKGMHGSSEKKSKNEGTGKELVS